jgi:hypothetical protein
MISVVIPVGTGFPNIGHEIIISAMKRPPARTENDRMPRRSNMPSIGPFRRRPKFKLRHYRRPCTA